MDGREDWVPEAATQEPAPEAAGAPAAGAAFVLALVAAAALGGYWLVRGAAPGFYLRYYHLTGYLLGLAAVAALLAWGGAVVAARSRRRQAEAEPGPERPSVF